MYYHQFRTKYGAYLSGRYIVRCVLLCSLLIWTILCIRTSVFPKKPELSLEFRHLQKLQEKTDKSEVCKVPRLDPWDPSIRKYYSKPDPLKCTPIQEQLATIVDGNIVFNKTLAAGLNCWIAVFTQGETDFAVKYTKQIDVDLSKTAIYKMDDEMFEVTCNKRGVMERQIFRYHWHNIVARKTNLMNKTVLPASTDHPPVVIIGLDSMSYGNMLRQLPKTHKTMQKMKFQDMHGHVKVGDNTFANWMAILTGKRATTTQLVGVLPPVSYDSASSLLTCPRLLGTLRFTVKYYQRVDGQPYKFKLFYEFDAELDESWNIFFDNWDFVWRNFSKNGYATLFAEDRPDIATFNYFGYLCGFAHPPVDHYFRPYWLAAFWSIVARRSSPFCYDRVPRHKVQLAYLDSFVKKYQGQRHFAFWWTQDMSHDYLNVIGKTDEDINNFLITNEKIMEDTIILVLSDHGHRYDKIRETVVGRLEARLPFLSIRIPEKIKAKYPHIVKNLEQNSGKLTTQFDLNESLNRIAWGTFGKRSAPTEGRRAYSLLHPTPEVRTCYQAGIPDDYCPCFTEVEIPSTEARQPAEVLLNYVNDLLTNFDNEEERRLSEKVEEKKKVRWSCQKLSLANITFASIRLPPRKVIDDPQVGGDQPLSGVEIQYRVVFQAAAPSNAIVEGVVVKDFNSGQWVTTGELERNNKYGNSSHCVADRTLKKVCHCLMVQEENL